MPDTGALRGDLIAFLNEHLLGFWRDKLCATVYRSLIAEAQNDAGASQALQAYQHERKAIAAAMIDRAVARGEVGQGADAGLIIDLMVSFAWHQLLIDRVEEAMSEIEPAVDMILGGVPGYRPAS
ncbi:MAG: TetR-like C-terminal domain-containing protein [Aliihoeflea sp.]